MKNNNGIFLKKYYILASILASISLLVKYRSTAYIDFIDIIICLTYFLSVYVFSKFFKGDNINNPLEEYELIEIDNPNCSISINDDNIVVNINDKRNLYSLKMITEFEENEDIIYITLDTKHLIILKKIIDDKFLNDLKEGINN